MVKQALRTAAAAAALGILLGLAMPATSHAAAARVEGTEVSAGQPGSAGLWQSFADLWDGAVALFAGTEDEGGDDEAGGPENGGGGGENAEGDGSGDAGGGADPNG